jgi:hypothetical protein
MASAMSALAIIIAPELRICQRILHTESLSLRQWLLCILAGLVTISVPELQKWLARRRAADEATAPTPAAAVPLGTAG